MAANEQEVGCYVVFLGDLEDGNFHVQTRARFRERRPEIVPMQALAEMNHTVAGVAAPIGPPSLTAEAWSAGHTSTAGDRPEEGNAVAVRDRAAAELQQRSLSTLHINQGESGHVVDEARDRARQDRRFARSTAHLTPQFFAEEMQRRFYNTSTATVEEVEVARPEGSRTSPTRSSSRTAPAPQTTPVAFRPAGQGPPEE